MAEDKVGILYKALASDENYASSIGDEATFRDKMKSPEKAKILYGALSSDEKYAESVGDETTFLSKVSSPKPPASSTKGGESGARTTPSTPTLPSGGSELGSWTETVNPLYSTNAAAKPTAKPVGNVKTDKPITASQTKGAERTVPISEETFKRMQAKGENVFEKDGNFYQTKSNIPKVQESYAPTTQQNISKIEGMTMQIKFPEYLNLEKKSNTQNEAFDFKKASAEAVSQEQKAEKEQTLKRREERRVQNLPTEIEKLRQERADLLLDKSPEAKKKVLANEFVTKKLQKEVDNLNKSKYENLQNLNQNAIKGIDLEINEYLQEDPKLKDKIKAVGLTDNELWDLSQRAIAKKTAPLLQDLQIFKNEGTIENASSMIKLSDDLRGKQEKMNKISDEMRSYETEYLNKTGFSGLNKEISASKQKLDYYEPYLKKAKAEANIHKKELDELKKRADSFSTLIKDNTWLGTEAQLEELKAIEKEYDNTVQDFNKVYQSESLLGYDEALTNYNNLINTKNNLVSGLKSPEYQKMADNLNGLKLEYDFVYKDYEKFQDPKIKGRINEYFSTVQKVNEYDEKLKTTKGQLTSVEELEKAQEKFNKSGLGGDLLDVGGRAINSIIAASKSLIASPFSIAASFSDLAGTGRGTYHYSDWIADLILGTGSNKLFLTKQTNNFYDAKTDSINWGFFPTLGALADQAGIILTLAVTGKYSLPIVEQRMVTAGMDLTAVAEASKAAEFATTVVPAFMISYGENYNQALSKGFSVEGAIAYSSGLSLLEGLTEKLLPNQDLIFGKAAKDQLLSGFIKDFSKGKKFAIANLAKKFVYNAGGEQVEENIAMLGEVAATALGSLTNENIEIEIPKINQIISTNVTSAISGGGMGLIGSISEQSQMYKMGVISLANDFETGKGLLDVYKEKGKIDEKRYNKLISDAQNFQSVRGQIPQGLSGFKTMAIFEKMMAIKGLSAQMDKDKTNPFNKINAKKISVIQGEIEQIVDDKNFDARAEYELTLESEELNKQLEQKPQEEKTQEEKPVELKKNTSPTPSNYGTINRNDGKGVVNLTKEEFEAEQANMQPKAEGTIEMTLDEKKADIEKRRQEELKQADVGARLLYDWESSQPLDGTDEALADKMIDKIISKAKGTDEVFLKIQQLGWKMRGNTVDLFNQFIEDKIAGKTIKTFSEWRNESKSNIDKVNTKYDAELAELNKAKPEAIAEETIKPTTNEKNDDGEQKRGKDGEENVPKILQSEGEDGGQQVDLKEKQVLGTEGAAEFSPIENPKVVIQGTRQGRETFESSNYDSKADGKVTEARVLTFDDNGVSIQKDNKGNQIVHIKVDATDDFNRRGNLQVSVIVPEGTNVNTKSIKEIVDAEVAKIKAKGNEDLKLGKVQQSDFAALKDAVVNELKNPSVAKSKAEVAPLKDVESTAKALDELNKQEEAALQRPYKQLITDAEKEYEYNRISGNFSKARDAVNEYIDIRKKIDAKKGNEVTDTEQTANENAKNKLNSLEIPFLNSELLDGEIYKNEKNDYEGVRKTYLDKYSEQNRYENKVKQEFAEKRKAVESLLSKEQTPKTTTNETSQKTAKETSTEGSVLEGLRDGGTKDEGGQESTELRTEEEEVAVEGSTVKLPPSMKGGMERTMVFKDGEWQQSIGGSPTKVGDNVKAEANEAFKASKKAEPTVEAGSVVEGKLTGEQVKNKLQEIEKQPVKINITQDANGKMEQTSQEVIDNIKTELDKTGLPYSDVVSNDKGSTYFVVTKDGQQHEILKVLQSGGKLVPTNLTKAKWINHLIKTEKDAVIKAVEKATQEAQKVEAKEKEVTTTQEEVIQEEEEEQYEPITVSDTSHDSFTKDNSVDYEEDEREGDNGRTYTYLSSVTVELTDDFSGDTIGTISKLKSEDGEVTYSAEDADGNQVAEEVSTKAEAQQAVVDKWNKQKLKEFNKEKAAEKKAKAKEAEKAKKKAEKEAEKAAKKAGKEMPAKTKSEQIGEGLLNLLGIENQGGTKGNGINVNNKSALSDLEGKTTGNKRAIIEAAKKAIATLKSVFPEMDIYIHEDNDSYNEVMEDVEVGGVKNSAGNFAYEIDANGNQTGRGRIDINLSKANSRTVAHEVSHAVMLKAFGDNPALFKSFRDKISKVLKDSSNKALMDFADQYVDEQGNLLDVTYEEYLAELTGALAAQEGKLSPTTLQKIAELINQIVSKLTNGKLKPFEDIKDTKQVVEFFSNIANSIRAGEDISNINDIGVSGTINATGVKSKSSLSSGEIKRFPVNKNVVVEEDVPMSKFDGKKSNLIESDRMTGGYVADSKGNPLFRFYGGVFYPIITGKWWASRNITKARAIAENGNKNRDADGYVYCTPMIGSNKQHMSNIDMLAVTVELMKHDVKDKKSKVKKEDIIVSLEKAFNRKGNENKKGLLKNILKNAKTIDQIFDELEYYLFQEGDKVLDRNNVAIMDEKNKPLPNFSFAQRLAIVNTILGDPKVKDVRFPSAGSITDAAKRFEEPVTSKVEAIGDAVTVMRTKGTLKYKKTENTDPFYHKSYPVEIYAVDEQGNAAEIEVYVLDGAYGMKETFPSLTQSSGKVFTWDEYIEKHKSQAKATAQYNRTAKLSSATGEIKSKSQKGSDISIETIDFENESENIDVYEASNTAEKIAKDNGVNILRGKELRSVALNKNGDVVGGLWTEISNNEFSFDIAVDKSTQGKGAGEKLVNDAISEFNAQDYEGELKYKIDVTNPIMEKLLSKYGFEAVDKFTGHTIMEHPTNNPKITSKSQLPQNSQIKDYIESQRAAGESDADIRAGIESVADRIGLTEEDINDLMSTTPKDTAATQPSVDKPNFKLEGEGREKERSFTNKQFLADKSIPNDVKAAVTEDAIFYNELPNSVSVEVANKIYDLLGSQEALDAILDENNGMSPVVRIVLGQVIIRRAKLQGGSKAEADIMLKAEALLAKKGTEYGQAIQAFSLFQFLSKEGQIMYAVKQRKQEIDAKLKKDKASVDARKNAVKKVNEKVINEVLDGKVGDVVDETTKIKPSSQSKNYGEKNKIVTKKRYEEIKKALRGKIFSNIPPELVELGVYHIEAGSRKFAEFSKAMIGDVGTGVKKYLRDLYDRAKSDYESNGGDVSGFSNEDEITDAENQDQAEKLAKFIVNRAKQKKQSNDPVKQMVSSLLAKVGEKLPKRELDKMTDIEKIALAIKNREQYADVWEKSKTEVEALIDKLNVSEEDKDRMRAELQSYYDEIIGQPFAETTLNKAVREGLNELNIDVKDVIRKHYTVADNAKRTLVEKLVMDANLSDADARYLAAKVEREFNRIATEKKKEALDKLKKPKDKIPTKKRQVNQLEDEIIALSNLGAFSDEEFLKIYAEKMGWKQISEADIKTIGRLAEIVEREQDGFRRARAVEDLLAFQARLKGTSLGDVSLSIWYANVLSGHDTQLVNFSANNGNLLINYAIALMRNPKDYKNLTKSILLGFRRGMLEAQSTLRTGYSPVRGRVEIPNTLELVDFTGILKPANMAKYVRRLMAAADVLTFEPAKEMRAYQMARKIAYDEGSTEPTVKQRQRALEIMGNTKEKTDAAKLQAQEEYNKRVKAINDNTDLTEAQKKKEIATERRDMKRRVFELIEQQRAKTSADIIPKSEDYARRLTYNYKPEGALGSIANLVNQATSLIPALKLVIPFTNIVANVANESLNYSPIGYIRAATSQGSIGASLFKKVKGNENFDADQKAEMIIKASIGVLSTIALFALTGGDPEDEDTIQITADGFGNYKDNYTLSNRGWQPYSIRVNGKWYSYKYWAVMPMFALIGKVRDSQHYKKEKFDDTYLTKFKSAAGSTVKTFFDNTFLSSINGFFNTIFNESTDNTIDDTMRGLMKTLNSFVLPNEVSQAAKEVESKMGIAVKDMDDRYYLQILKDVPFARNIFQNKVNALGDDIIPDTDKFISEVKIVDPKVASVNDLWAILVKNKYPLRTMSYNEFNNDGIYDPNEDKQRVITPEEYYGYMKVKGGTIKEFMFNNYEDLQDLTPKEFSFIMGKVKQKSTEIAKLSIFEDYYEEDISKIVSDLESIDIPKEVEKKNKEEEKEE